MLSLALLLMFAPVQEAPVLTSGTVVEAAARLRPGQYLWAPQVAPSGAMVMIVNLETQRATVYRNGVPIGITTVSTGRRGHETPPGVYTILQKDADHRSSLYDDAPMPFMQRLTWDGIALHGGLLPGYPASHGCIRLPEAFARLLFRETRIGMLVIVTRLSIMPTMAITEAAPLLPDRAEPTVWRGDEQRAAPLSIVVSTADREVRVIRAGKEIGAAPVTFTSDVPGPVAFQRQADGRWLRLLLPGQQHVEGPELGQDAIQVDPVFRARVLAAAGPGSTVVVTPDRLRPELSIATALVRADR
ncbi:L,D-transpeptidase family protein [uncultured Sphingomonas sp.]|uniref:L,D-transpeptidase family protein n=1 Tax=uncultured Sphingomonas sp. TaxID=158754 RepID=UPI0025E1839A|nr:L,D-transpeptidase family protein [uncultured Sphingomonas sp.]